jgi:hypothetical protein
VQAYFWRIFAVLMLAFEAKLWGLPEPVSGLTDLAITATTYSMSFVGMAGLFVYGFGFSFGSARLWNVAKYLFAIFAIAVAGGAWWVGGQIVSLPLQILGTFIAAAMFSLNWVALHKLSGRDALAN